MIDVPVSALGAVVRSGDPERFEAALFAAEPVRDRLFALYAYDLELRAAWRRVSEPALGAIRLRFWVDTIEEAAAGKSARAHEIAEPLHSLITEANADPAALAAMAEARNADFEPRAGDDREEWLDRLRRSDAATMRVAAHLALGRPLEKSAAAAVDALGLADGVARAIEAAPRLAAEGRLRLPLSDDAAAALFDGAANKAFCDEVAELARIGLNSLEAARRGRPPPTIAAATLAAWRAPRILAAAARLTSLDALGPESPARRRLSLLWRAWRGW